jgi:alkaline phosphatase
MPHKHSVTTLIQFRLSLLVLLCLCVPLHAQQQAKYVFFFIGDGMGPQQRLAADLYWQAQTGDPQAQLLMNKLPVKGNIQTRSANSEVTDSAAGGTALACGHKTNNGVIGLASDLTTSLPSIAVYAHQAGMKVGILTTVPIDHATPAVFYAHQIKRNMYPQIASELAQSPFEYFAAGGMNGKRNGAQNNLDLAKQNGFVITHTRDELMAIQPGTRVVALCESHNGFNNALPWDQDMQADDVPLAELVANSIRLLDQDKGFFMMAEGGMIDWAAHSNSLSDVARETIALNNAVQVAYDFYKQHPDQTLIVITADHETGGMEQLGKPNFASLLMQSASYDMFKERIKDMVKNKQSFEDALSYACEFFNLPQLNDEEIATMQKGWQALLDGTPIKHAAGPNDPFTEACLIYQARQAGYRFTTHGHSSANVPVTAVGVGAQAFAGTYDNTLIPRQIYQAIFGKDMP